MDLLTVVSHELGHVLGLSDASARLGALMSGSLETGVRRTPTAADVAMAAGIDWLRTA